MSLKLNSFWNSLYTMWLSNYIGYIPKGSLIKYPCRLEGGGSNFISIGNNVTIESHAILGCWIKYGNKNYRPTIKIGDNSSIGEYCQISAITGITIGNGLLTGRYVFIGDNAHGGLSWEEANIRPQIRDLKSKGEIIIGNNVWIGERAIILGGVNIGDNVIIGANSFVNHDIPSNSVAAGTPAKVIKELL